MTSWGIGTLASGTRNAAQRCAAPPPTSYGQGGSTFRRPLVRLAVTGGPLERRQPGIVQAPPLAGQEPGSGGLPGVAGQEELSHGGQVLTGLSVVEMASTSPA